MKVLIVDDDAAVRSSLCDGINTFGIKVIQASESGWLTLAKATKMLYDLVTPDMGMSKASGINVLSVICWMRPRSVIAMLPLHEEII